MLEWLLETQKDMEITDLKAKITCIEAANKEARRLHKKRLAAAEKVVALMRTVLLELEWCGYRGKHGAQKCCPLCQAFKTDRGHNKDCKLAAAKEASDEATD